jgi:hypothetical protein
MSGRGRALRELRARGAHVPGDELPDHPRPIARSHQPAERIPKVIAHPDRAVRGVRRLLHATHRNPWISPWTYTNLPVDIHGR